MRLRCVIQPLGVRNVCGTGNVREDKRVLAPRAPFIYGILGLKNFSGRASFLFRKFLVGAPSFLVIFLYFSGRALSV